MPGLYVFCSRAFIDTSLLISSVKQNDECYNDMQRSFIVNRMVNENRNQVIDFCGERGHFGSGSTVSCVKVLCWSYVIHLRHNKQVLDPRRQRGHFGSIVTLCVGYLWRSYQGHNTHIAE